MSQDANTNMDANTMTDCGAEEYDFIRLSRSAADAPMGEYVILIVKARSNGVKNILAFNTDGTLHRWPDSMPEDEAARLRAEFISVHLSHCCAKHGCKYGEHDECPVAKKLIAQEIDECETCWEDKADAERKQNLIDSFQVSVRDSFDGSSGEVGIAFDDETTWVEPHVARTWARQLHDAAGQVKPTYACEYAGDMINIEEWAHLTYVVHPSEISGIWVGHCLETNVVSQGDGPEEALEMTLQAAAIVIETDKREGLDPFERMAPSECWPPERLVQWTKIRAEKGAQATWKGFDPCTESFIEKDAEGDDDE